MRQFVYGIGVTLPILLLATGCVATRTWVEETVGKRTTAVDQRAAEIDQRVAAVDKDRRQDAGRIDGRLDQQQQRVEQQGERLDGLGRQVQGLEGSVGTATETAKGAKTRADDVDARLTRLWDGRNVRKLADSMNVQFPFNSADLNDAAQTSLVAVVRELQQNAKLMIELEGYADPKGDRDYNVVLSQRRVEAVRRHLVRSGIELGRIDSIGLGSLIEANVPDAAKRRVTVKLMLLGD
jgi:outer membrane protein OmpA-like peptidoglycan-associated protein